MVWLASAFLSLCVCRVFPYLVGREDDNGNGGRFVAALKFKIFQDLQPFEVRSAASSGDLDVCFRILLVLTYVLFYRLRNWKLRTRPTGLQGPYCQERVVSPR